MIAFPKIGERGPQLQITAVDEDDYEEKLW